ncbi:hypothetical protein H2248_005077 [Termitomyces sp. 'cryptogamus']|nr:hypothetical protein H2248_005077 [Termitomyces sp. 'cryptogamus']
MQQRHVLVVHGGAGTMSKQGSTPAQRAAYKDGLRAALEAVCLPCVLTRLLMSLTALQGP